MRHNGQRSHEADTFDVIGMVSNVRAAAKRYRLVVVATCVLTLALVTLYVKLWPPLYRASALMMVERDEDLARDEFYVNWNIFRKEDVRSEIELMTTGPVLKEVIERANLGYDDIYHPVTAQLRIFWESSWLGRQYTRLKEKLSAPQQQLLLSEEEIELGKTINDLAAGISIIPLGESSVGELRVKGPSPRVAEVANTLVDVYLEQRTERYRTEAARALAALSAEVELAEQQLMNIEERRVAYFAEYGLELNLQKELVEVERLTGIEADIAKARERIASTGAALRVVERQLASEPQAQTLSSSRQLNSVREAAKIQLLEHEVALIVARNRYHEDSPEVAEIKTRISELEALLGDEPEIIEVGATLGVNPVRQELTIKRNQLETDLAAAQAGLAVLEQSAAELQARLDKIPAIQMDIHRLDREQGLLLERFSVLSLKHAQAQISLTTTGAAMSSMRVVAYAVPPTSKSWPRLSVLYPAALMMGLFLGLVAAVIAFHASGRLRRADIERERLPLLGTIVVPKHGRRRFVEVRGHLTGTSPSPADHN